MISWASYGLGAGHSPPLAYITAGNLAPPGGCPRRPRRGTHFPSSPKVLGAVGALGAGSHAQRCWRAWAEWPESWALALRWEPQVSPANGSFVLPPKLALPPIGPGSLGSSHRMSRTCSWEGAWKPPLLLKAREACQAPGAGVRIKVSRTTDALTGAGAGIKVSGNTDAPMASREQRLRGPGARLGRRGPGRDTPRRRRAGRR